MSAAYNLARWLTRDDTDAQDVVQESYMRALKFFGGFRGGDGRSWLLRIVRNTCHTWLERNRPRETSLESSEAEVNTIQSSDLSPERQMMKKGDEEMLQRALEELPLEFREVIIMRELEGLSYKEIAEVTDIPIGTVMSRLARARTKLQQRLAGSMHREAAR
jgi:RNA polymerase sigma-70 factor (ECF subfamily)